MSNQAEDFHSRTFPGYFNLFELTQLVPERYPYLLETTAKSSTQVSSKTARYDILFCFPQNKLIKAASGDVKLDGHASHTNSFLESLDSCWRKGRNLSTPDHQLPFFGGWFIYASYELVSEIEPGLDIPQIEGELPVAMAVRIPAAVIYDHYKDETTIVAEPGYLDNLQQIENDLCQIVEDKKPDLQQRPPIIEEEDPEIYRKSLKKIHQYIRDGDVFQVNLSRHWAAKQVRDKPADIYRRLRTTNPAPFSGYINFGNGILLSSSPERLVSVTGDQVQTRPIAGTRPRGTSEQTDEALQEELITNPKERAEHVMLIDLERNDLGRICIPGSVKVDECMVIESYAHVHHIVSNVTGTLCADVTPGQVIRAVFPGGTITGCPKVRCMEIIAELEQTARGPYTGSIGYLGHNGDMDLNILIRTILIENSGLSFRAGAGLVADSNVEKELDETRAKAKGMLLAITEENTHG